MKKNRMMRLASGLLVAVLLTTCMISGTFAKYVTSGEGSDKARVAKFGVNVEVEGTTFAKEYDAEDPAVGDYEGNVIAKSVVSTEEVVAPGTLGFMGGVALTGTPEVAVEVKYDATVDIGDKWVYKYTDMDGNEQSEYYCPLVISVTNPEGNIISSYYGMDYENADAFESAIEEAIDANTVHYQANTDLSKAGNDFYLIWEWGFEKGVGSSQKNDDVKDTYLGDQAAAGNAAEVSITLAVTVTQID